MMMTSSGATGKYRIYEPALRQSPSTEDVQTLLGRTRTRIPALGRVTNRCAILILATLVSAASASAASSGDTLEVTDPPEVDPLVELDQTGPGAETTDRFPPELDTEKLDSAISNFFGDQDTQGLPEPDGLVMATLKTFAWLCVILSAILLLYYLVRRFGKRMPFLAGPNLGAILGQVHLSPRVCLHFVRIRDRVLVIGVTNTSVSRVAEFDAALFDPEPEAPESESPKNPGGFLRHLQASLIGDSAEEPPEPLPISREPYLDSAPTPPDTKPPSPEPMPRPEPAPVAPSEPTSSDDEIAALRDGIERLQKQIQDTSRELDL